MKYILLGQILPSSPPVNLLSEVVTFGGIECIFKCTNSQVEIEMSGDGLNGNTAYFGGKEIGEIVVSTHSFAYGGSFNLNIDSIENDQGETHKIKATASELMEEGPDETYEGLISLALKDIYVRSAIKDYVSALSNQVECGFLCYRAIETIKNRILLDFPEIKKDNAQWSKMHEVLKTNGEEIKRIVKVFADPVRHGNYYSLKPIGYQDRLNIHYLTRGIIYKYKKYLEELS
jgi:hypothetical protein